MFSEVQNSSGTPAQRYSLNGETMGTRYSAVFFAPPGLDAAAIHAQLFAAVDAVDRQMSTWKPDSDLSRLNAAPVQQWLTMPPELVSVLLALVSQLLMFAVLVYLPLQMQWQKGMGASESGLYMVIFMVCITAGAFVGGKLIGRTGYYKRFVVVGFALSALALWQIHFDVWASLGLGFAGLGLRLVLPALAVVVQNALPAADRGIGMSLFNFGRELGGFC